MAEDRRGRAKQARQALYRELVLEAAQAVFAKSGYDDAKMEEIAQEAGLALGTLYSVFSGKAEIFGAIHRGADEELLRTAEESARGLEEPLQVVLESVRAYTRYFLEHPDFLCMHLHEGQTWGSDKAARGSRERTEAWRLGIERFRRSFERCIDAGVFVSGDPELMARMMVAMTQVQLAHWVEHGMERPHEEVVEAICEQVERSFRADRPESRLSSPA